MSRLVNRQRSIPNGLSFYIPHLRWRPRPYSSFDQIVKAVIAVRQGNPEITRKMGWSTDYRTVEDEVDAYNTAVCEKMGWRDFITGDGGAPAIPFRQASPMSKASQLGGGLAVVVDWIKSGAEAVEPALANKRAEVCVACPLNSKGDFTSIFTVPVSNAIRKALNERKSMNLSTAFDEKLRVCTACGCPLPLKIHLPIARIISRLPAESKAALHPSCWITSEAK